ncbi:hypothetical protein ACOSQ4_005058 [Xanthoceras sorbifolium]
MDAEGITKLYAGMKLTEEEGEAITIQGRALPENTVDGGGGSPAKSQRDRITTIKGKDIAWDMPHSVTRDFRDLHGDNGGGLADPVTLHKNLNSNGQDSVSFPKENTRIDREGIKQGDSASLGCYCGGQSVNKGLEVQATDQAILTQPPPPMGLQQELGLDPCHSFGVLEDSHDGPDPMDSDLKISHDTIGNMEDIGPVFYFTSENPKKKKWKKQARLAQTIYDPVCPTNKPSKRKTDDEGPRLLTKKKSKYDGSFLHPVTSAPFSPLASSTHGAYPN